MGIVCFSILFCIIHNNAIAFVEPNTHHTRQDENVDNKTKKSSKDNAKSKVKENSDFKILNPNIYEIDDGFDSFQENYPQRLLEESSKSRKKTKAEEPSSKLVIISIPNPNNPKKTRKIKVLTKDIVINNLKVQNKKISKRHGYEAIPPDIFSLPDLPPETNWVPIRPFADPQAVSLENPANKPII